MKSETESFSQIQVNYSELKINLMETTRKSSSSRRFSLNNFNAKIGWILKSSYPAQTVLNLD